MACTSSTPAFIAPDFDASYLIVEKGRAAFVDTGTNFSCSAPAANAGRARPGARCGRLRDPDPRASRPCRRRRPADGASAGRTVDRPSARRAPHDRPGPPGAGRTGGLRRRGGGAVVWRGARRRTGRARHDDAGRDGDRTRRARADVLRPRRATRAIIMRSGMRAAAASSPAIPSACRTASSTRRVAPGSCRAAHRCSSIRWHCATRSIAC